jgi:uncharacterized protein (DUF1330 family)
MTLVAILTMRRQAEALFRDYETAAAAIMARHGGAIERVVSVSAPADDSTFVEIHLVTFPDAAAFEAYRNDPDLAALGEQRSRAIVATELFNGDDHPPYRAPYEPRRRSFTGGCHCGRVRFRVIGDLSTTTECNCSICTQKGFLHLIVPSPDFELLAGRDDLTTYTFNTGVARHTFCRHCGMHPFYVPRSDPDKIDVNVRCLEGVDVRALGAKLFDGRNWEEAIRAAVPWR